MRSAVASGVIGLVVSFVATSVVHLLIPSSDLSWALVAVSIAGFCAAYGGYVSGSSAARKGSMSSRM